MIVKENIVLFHTVNDSLGGVTDKSRCHRIFPQDHLSPNTILTSKWTVLKTEVTLIWLKENKNNSGKT